jgi:hypothetical protein
MLNDWITLLTDNNKKKNKTKNKQYGIIRQIKLRYAAKAMNGTKVPQEKLTTSLKRSHLLQLQVVSFEVIVITNQEVKEKSDLLSICSN